MVEKNKDITVYRSCEKIEKCHIQIISVVNKCITPCCAMHTNDNALMELFDDPEMSLNEFYNLRENIINEYKSAYQSNEIERKYTSCCVNCPEYVEKDWGDNDERISYVNLSMFQSPCQSKCMYCNIDRLDIIDSDKLKKAYNKLFNFLFYLKDNGIINENTTWQLSPGEITIHPYRDKMFELVGNNKALFLTNGFLFSEEIASKLNTNNLSILDISLDSGTPETWKKVKGVDNFKTVIENLAKYYEYCDPANHQQFILKYIVMPGINAHIKDYLGFITIAKKLQIKWILISRDLNIKDMSASERIKLLRQVTKFAKLCKIHNIEYALSTESYTTDDVWYVKSKIIQNLHA